uniref:Envelope glycoprotein gp160 n=1 Tax=Simian immunodeficiency virus TaxID=11723 RepID=A0A1W6I4S5_SIV|nr:envelope glycoprotein [Simian immunodeficiency virus]
MKLLLSFIVLVVLGLEQDAQAKNWTTVFYGVPIWKDAKPPLFCAADIAPDPFNIWATQSCVPTDPTPAEAYMNITEYFDAYKNYMVQQMTEDMIALFQQALKPCVKLTPMCVTMKCVKQDTPKTMTTTTRATTTTKATTTTGYGDMTPQSVYNCSFNQTIEFRDKKKQMYALFYRQDIMSTGKENDTYYMWNCNTSYITQDCTKSDFHPFPIQYCAPAGYALLYCRDQNFTGQGLCRNVTARHCTHGIQPLISTWLQLNGTYETEETRAYMQKGKKESVMVRLGIQEHIQIECIRPGNKTIRNLQIGAGMSFYSQLIVGGNTRRAYCRLKAPPTNKNVTWDKVMSAVVDSLKKKWADMNETENATNTKVHFYTRPQGDRETQVHWFQCAGEFFYCNLSALYEPKGYTWQKNCTNASSPLCPVEMKNETNYQMGRWMSCTIRQFVTQWGIVGKAIYLPPRRGHVNCTSNITGLIFDGHMFGNYINFTPSADVQDNWRAELARYKVVEIKPMSFAPTSVRRYEAPRLSKRAVSLAVGFIGFLGAAGSTMGAAATALTVQSRSLLAGILQQQQNLLRAIEAQQHLLQLSVWGIKNLNARLTALEKYLKDQQILNIMGCAWRQICHSNVEWNESWSGGVYPDWDTMTWEEWSVRIDNHTREIEYYLGEAEKQEERNNHQLQKLHSWDFLWSWFDISNWLYYIKIAILVIAGLIALRIVMFVLGVFRRLRLGYSPLSSAKIPFQNLPEPEAPEGIEESAGGAGKTRSVRLLTGFFAIIWDDLRNLLVWSYQILAGSASTIWWCLEKVWDWLIIRLAELRGTVVTFCRHCLEAARRLLAYLQYGFSELQAAVTQAIDRLAIFTGAWTDAVLEALRRLAWGIIHLPRRIRQGLEILLN